MLLIVTVSRRFEKIRANPFIYGTQTSVYADAHDDALLQEKCDEL